MPLDASHQGVDVRRVGDEADLEVVVGGREHQKDEQDRDASPGKRLAGLAPPGAPLSINSER
jgi:hypothetical protein